jgi:hypothetical protein
MIRMLPAAVVLALLVGIPAAGADPNMGPGAGKTGGKPTNKSNAGGPLVGSPFAGGGRGTAWRVRRCHNFMTSRLMNCDGPPPTFQPTVIVVPAAPPKPRLIGPQRMCHNFMTSRYISC